MAKFDAEERAGRGLPNPPEVELALRQLAAGAVAAGEVMDIFAAAGIDRPDLTHLDEAFIQRMLRSTRPNLAIEALRRMLERQIRATHPHNLVAQRRFSDRLLEAMRRYTNNALTHGRDHHRAGRTRQRGPHRPRPGTRAWAGRRRAGLLRRGRHQRVGGP